MYRDFKDLQYMISAVIQKRDQEIVDLKSKMSEVMALMPPNAVVDGITMPSSGNSSPSPLYSPAQSQSTTENGTILKSNLNPNAKLFHAKTNVD